MRRLDKRLTQIIAENASLTLKMPLMVDLRSADLCQRFAKANREQIHRNSAWAWRETVKAKRAPVLPTNVIRFGEGAKS